MKRIEINNVLYEALIAFYFMRQTGEFVSFQSDLLLKIKFLCSDI